MRSKKLTAIIFAAALACSAAAFEASASSMAVSAAVPSWTTAAQEETKELLNISGGEFVYSTKQVYDGKAKTPKVVVKLDGKALVSGRDYDISYSSNTDIGKGKITIKGKGNYTGSKKLTFSITAPSIGAPSALRCSDANVHIICMRWNGTKDADGYELQYYDSSAKKWTGLKTIGKGKQYYKYSNSAFKVGTQYTMRIRAYRTLCGKKYYSSWVKGYGTTDPEKVSGLKEVAPEEKGYTLVWNKAAGAQKYEVMRWSPVSGKYEVIKTVNTNQVTISDRTPGQKNTYKIRAIRTVKGSDLVFHGEKTSIKATSVCRVVTGIKAKTDFDTVTISWGKVAKANGGYEVYYTDARGNNPKTLATVGSGKTSFTTKSIPTNAPYKVKVKAISTYGNVTTKSTYPAGVRVRTFNRVSYNSVLDSYVNDSAITINNSHGYSIPSAMYSRLDHALKDLGGVVSFAMLDLESGTLIASHGKTYMGTASTVKMPFMLYCLHEMEDGYPTMDTTMTYTSADYHGGSGIIQTYNYGTVLTNRDIFETIFTYSDNIGLYMLQREFGIDGYNRYISSLGCRTSMSYYNRWGIICATDSAKEWIQMYNYFKTGKYGDYMRDGMSRTCASSFRNGLGDKYTVYSKCGWTETYHHDTAVIEAEHPYVLIGFTDRVSGPRLMEVSRAADEIHNDLWNYFLGK